MSIAHRKFCGLSNMLFYFLLLFIFIWLFSSIILIVVYFNILNKKITFKNKNTYKYNSVVMTKYLKQYSSIVKYMKKIVLKHMTFKESNYIFP
jgi:hypothetical protein